MRQYQYYCSWKRALDKGYRFWVSPIVLQDFRHVTVSLTHVRINKVPVPFLDSYDASKLDESVAPSGADTCVACVRGVWSHKQPPKENFGYR